MRNRFRRSMIVAVAMAAILSLAVIPVGGQARAYKAPRTTDGKPNLNGIWQALTEAYWDIEGHAAAPGVVTVLGAAAAVAPGLSIVEGGPIPYKEEAVELVRRAAEVEAEQTEPGTIPDVHYDFTQFGLDRSQGGFALNLRTSLIVDPSDGRLPPRTPEGQKRAAERAEARKRMGPPTDAAQNQSLSVRCILMDRAGPPMLPGAYNNNYQIVQAPGYVMILVEMIHDVRIIPLDGRPHLPHNVRQWMGSYVGHWEGETLVVETTNFTGKTAFQGSSENMRLIERFTRVAEDTILYQFTVDDPATWPRPWSAELPMKKTIGPLFEHACHEGNYALSNTLAGARAEEKRAAEGAAKTPSK